MLNVISRAEPTTIITLDEVKEHLVISGTQDDSRLAGVLAAAVRYCETAIAGGRTIPETEYQYLLNDWPTGCKVYLPKPPLISVEEVTYYDSDNVLQTLVEDTDFRVIGIASEEQAFIELLYAPPATYDRSDSIAVEFTAGYDDLNPMLRAAVLLLCGHYNEHRESVVTGTIAAEVQQGVKDLLGLSGWGYCP